MGLVLVLRSFVFLSIGVSILGAQPSIFPLKDIRPGQHGIGRTVFNGSKSEEFQVEILGVLDNLGPKQSVILARLSGGPLEKTGVMQGMSGSPVYIDGKLVGAVALAFSYSKEAITGIRPIEEMLAVQPSPSPVRTEIAARERQPQAPEFGASKLVDIATPLSFNGFTPATLEHFGPVLRKLGFEPAQGVSSGGHPQPKMGDPALLHAGDMISVQLVSGDLNMGADGTVTLIDGNRVFAFGHQFLSAGGTDIPFARAQVLALLPSVQASFKISTALEWMGSITQDRSAAISGELGRRARTIPISIGFHGSHEPATAYNMQMAADRTLSPLILQMAVYSVIDANERSLGLGSFTVKGAIEFEKGIPPVRLDNTYAGDFGVPAMVSNGVAAPLTYALSGGFDALSIKDIDISIEASEAKRLLQVDQITARKDAQPGQNVDLALSFTGENGAIVTKHIAYPLPVGTPTGFLTFTVTDAMTSNFAEYMQYAGTLPKSPTQAVTLLNKLRRNTKAYLRVTRNEITYQAQGVDLPDPPPSLALLLSKSQNPALANQLAQGNLIAEIPIDMGDSVVSGTKSIQVEVKE